MLARITFLSQTGGGFYRRTEKSTSGFVILVNQFLNMSVKMKRSFFIVIEF